MTEDIAPVSPEEDVNRLATILYSSVDARLADNKVVVDFQLRLNQQVIQPEVYKLAKSLLDEAIRIINEERVIVY